MARLGEEGEDGGPGMASNDRHTHTLWWHPHLRRNKRIRPANIERSDAEQAICIIAAPLLKDLAGDGNCRVDGVCNDEHPCLWAHLQMDP